MLLPVQSVDHLVVSSTDPEKLSAPIRRHAPTRDAAVAWCLPSSAAGVGGGGGGAAPPSAASGPDGRGLHRAHACVCAIPVAACELIVLPSVRRGAAVCRRRPDPHMRALWSNAVPVIRYWVFVLLLPPMQFRDTVETGQNRLAI